MTVQFRWAEADYASAGWAWYKHHPWKLALGFWYSILILVVVGIAAFENPQSWRIELSVSVGIVGFAVLVQRYRWHRYFAKTPLFHDDVSAAIDGQSIKLSGKTFQAIHQWGGFSDVYETGRVFVLEKTTSAFVFLPKAGMGQSQIHELRSVISANAKCKVKFASP